MGPTGVERILPTHIDLLLDTGTVSNIVPEDRRDLVQDIHDEHTSLIGVGGARVVARETGQAGVFGRSRIVPGTGAICISQRQFGDKFQMINPHKDLVILECMRKHRDAVFSVMSPQKEERTSSQPDGLSGASPLNLGNYIVARRAVEVLAILS